MTKALLGVVLLVAACGVSAQEESAGRTNAAAGFNNTSASQVQLVSMDADSSAPLNASMGNPAPTAASEAAPAADPAPAPRYIFGDRDDYRWQLGVGFEYFRFQSSAFDTNMIGLNTTLTYYTNDWFGVEGDVVTVFSPDTVNANDHGKLFGGAGGFRIGGRRAKWEPWGHALVGGAHLQPQTAYGSRNAIMAIIGGGMDYRVHARLSLRGEADYVYTGYFSQSQSNFQIIAGAVLHF
jgi:opacity protein-like surface antigen